MPQQTQPTDDDIIQYMVDCKGYSRAEVTEMLMDRDYHDFMGSSDIIEMRLFCGLVPPTDPSVDTSPDWSPLCNEQGEAVYR